MSEIKQLLVKQSNIKKLDLSNRKINDTHNIFKELENFFYLNELDLSGNDLTYLPNNLSFLANLRVLDISNNLLENFEKVSSSLETLPKLTDLKINLSTQTEALAILNNLPNLEYLNGKSTKDDESHLIDLEEREIENISFDKEELEKFNKLFQKISEKTVQLGKETEKINQEQYQEILKKEIDKINSCIENITPNYVYASEILSSKLKISKFLVEKFMDYTEIKDAENTMIYKEIFSHICVSNTNLFELLDRLYPKINEKTNNLRNQIDTMSREAGAFSETMQAMEDRMKQMEKEREFIIKQYEDERELLLDKIQKLEDENKLMTEKILKKTKDLLNESSQNLRKFEEVSSYNDLHSKSKLNINIHSINSKVISKKLMKDTIEQMYESKTNFDKKCFDNKMPRETMEQHMYTFLNYRFGIKSLIIEWATSIINGIKHYSNEDNDICVFGKILRNECEEEFRQVMLKIKNTIKDLLGFYIKGKFPLKSNGDIKDIVTQKINTYLMEDEWKEIIYYMYEEGDGNFLYNKIMDLIKRKYIDTKPPVDEKNLTREEILNMSRTKEDYRIPFPDFQKVILDFQLKCHDKFLKNFIHVFKKIDLDNNGILSEDEFTNLLNLFSLFKEDFNEQVSRLLYTIDPFNKKQITFSEIITLFNNEYILENDEHGIVKKISFLEKISLDERLLKI